MKILFIFQKEESIGLEYLSSILKKHGHTPHLLFLRDLKKIPLKRILREVNKIKPNVVAFSVFTDKYQESCKIAEFIKLKYDTLIVFGGIHPTLVPNKVIKKDFIDFVIVGEGEYAFLRLIQELEHNKNFSNIKNLLYKTNGKVKKNKVGRFVCNLDSLPFPHKPLFYNQAPELESEYNIITMRGCPFNCTYCCNSFLKKMYNAKNYVRRRSQKNVIHELEYAKKKFKMKKVWFLDENFVSDSEWLRIFLKLYKNKINLKFKCSANPKDLTKNTVGLLKTAGCYEVKIGVQTVNEDLKRGMLNRFDTNEEISLAIKLLKKAGIYSFADYIFGIPNEKKKDHVKAAYFFNKFKPNYIRVFWFKYFPNTPIVDICKKKGLINQDDTIKSEEGVMMDYFKVIENIKHFKKIALHASLFLIMPYLPKSFASLVIKKRLYLLFPRSVIFYLCLEKIMGITRILFLKNIRPNLKGFLSPNKLKHEWMCAFR